MGFNNNENRRGKNRILGEQKLTSKSLQESQLSVMLRRREKVDGLYTFTGIKSRNFETCADDRQQIHAPPKSIYDARQSLAWDSTFFTSPGVLEPEELQTLNFSVLDDVTIFGKAESTQSEVSESGGARRFCESNSRVSLAWDSAFFTSPGVLNPEELLLINKGWKKSPTYLASRFDEALCTSIESNLTADSSNISLECLESSLFEEVASSTWKENAADRHNSSCKIQSKTISDKLGASSQVRMKLAPAPGRKSFRQRRSKKNAVDASQHPKSHKQSTRSDESTILSSLKPSKILRQTDMVSLAPSKRDTLCAKHAKTDNKASKLLPGRKLFMSKKTFLEELDCVTLAAKSTNLLSKSSPAPVFKASTYHIPSNKFDTAASSTSYTHSTSSSVAKSKTRSNRPGSSHSKDPNPAWMPNSYSYKSPASSFKSARGGNLKSSVTPVKYRSHTNCELWQSVIYEGDTSVSSHIKSHSCHQTGALAAIQGNHEAVLPDKCIKKVPSSSALGAAESITFKPSALRIPSPKIGYFDEDKSLTMPSTIGALQFDSGGEIISSRTKSGTTDLMRSHRPKNQKDQATETQDNLIHQQDGILSSDPIPLHPTPIPQTEVVETSPEVSNITERPTFSLSTAFKLPNLFEGEIKTKSLNKRTRVLSYLNTPGEKKGQARFAHLEELETATPCSSLDPQFHQQIQNNKENLYDFANQVNSLCRHVGAIDLGGMTELKSNNC